MKMTVELPDQLFRTMKIRAVHEHKKLKDVATELIERGLRSEPRKHVELPKPLKLRGGFVPTTEDIEAAIAEDRDRF
jgi:hypothetical protein